MTTLSHRLSRGTLALALSTAAFAMVTTASAHSHAKKTSAPKHTVTQSAGTIVDAAVATPQLSTLVSAVTAANLVDTLAGPGPFTVFAPTDSAFTKLPSGTVATLLKPENKPQLVKILTSHVVAGNLSAKDLLDKININGGKAYIETLSGAKLKVYTYNGKVYIKDEQGNKSMVSKANIMKDNGTVHVINGVLLPAEKKHSS